MRVEAPSGLIADGKELPLDGDLVSTNHLSSGILPLWDADG